MDRKPSSVAGIRSSRYVKVNTGLLSHYPDGGNQIPLFSTNAGMPQGATWSLCFSQFEQPGLRDMKSAHSIHP